jgi:hypothetical protein
MAAVHHGSPSIDFGIQSLDRDPRPLQAHLSLEWTRNPHVFDHDARVGGVARHNDY